jgi:hypothetical protein
VKKGVNIKNSREEPLPGPPLKGREINPIYLPSLEGRAGERFFKVADRVN